VFSANFLTTIVSRFPVFLLTSSFNVFPITKSKYLKVPLSVAEFQSGTIFLLDEKNESLNGTITNPELICSVERVALSNRK